MSMFIATSLVAASITSYPAFGDKGVVAPRKVEQAPRVEMAIDKGPIVELTIRCPHSGTAIVSYSKIEKVFCGPKVKCGPSLVSITQRICH